MHWNAFIVAKMQSNKRLKFREKFSNIFMNAAEKERELSGYYTPEAEKQRELAKHDKIIAELQAERDELVLKANNEYNVKVAVLKIGGTVALKNCIFYTHSNTLSFNWRSYDMISTEMYEKIAATIQLPEGVKIQNANGK